MNWQFYPATEFERHAAAWDDLQRRSTDTPFLESAFLLPLLQVYGNGSERIAFCSDDSGGKRQAAGGFSAATIVRPLGRGRWETFQPSQLPLGPVVADPGADLAALARTLLRQLPGLALSVGLTQLDPRLHPRPATRPALRLQDYVSTSFIDVQGSFDDYWEARGKNLRQNTRKLRNRLQAEGVPLRLEIVSAPDEVDAALAHYGALESAGWKAQSGTAIGAANEQGRFYSAMLKRFCALGRGRIVRYWMGEQVAAMDLCIDNGPLVVILKTAYDETLKQHSPSVLMRQDEFKNWWDEGRYRRIEFYGKTMEWHTRWTGDERLLYHATTYRWAWIAKAREWALRRHPAAPDAQAAPDATRAAAAG
jgi:CelD/BcsL family acetyltransferase involved in cellulose biosynthesis